MLIGFLAFVGVLVLLQLPPIQAAVSSAPPAVPMGSVRPTRDSYTLKFVAAVRFQQHFFELFVDRERIYPKLPLAVVSQYITTNKPHPPPRLASPPPPSRR